MAGRYFQLPDNNYSIEDRYVPLPFDRIAAAAEGKQKQYDVTKNALDKSILDNNIKSIDYHDQARNQFMNQWNKDASELASSNIDFGSAEGRSKVNQLLYQYKNNPDLQTYARSIENKKKTEDQRADIMKQGKGAYQVWNDPIAMDEKLYSMGINRYVDEKTGRPKEYPFQPMEAAANQIDPIHEIFKPLKDSGTITAYATPTENAYIASGKDGWKGVSRARTEKVAAKNVDTYLATPGGQDFQRQFMYENAEQLAKMKPEDAEQAFHTATLKRITDVGEAYIHGEKIQDRGLKSDATALHAAAAEKEKMRTRGMSIEGSTMDLLGESAKKLKENGIFKSDGTIDWNAVGSQNQVFAGPISGQLITANGDVAINPIKNKNGDLIENSVEKNKMLGAEIKKMATALGEDFNKLSAQKGDYDRIYKEFNEFSKTRGFDVQLTPAISESISSYINKGGINNYTIQANDKGEYKDIDKLDDETKVLVANPNTHIQVINRRDKEGKMVLEGLVTGKNGEHLGKVNLRPKAKEETNYYDAVSGIQNAAIGYMTTKDLKITGDRDSQKVRSEIGTQVISMLKKDAPTIYNAAIDVLNTENPVLINQTKLPTGKVISSFANPKIPGKQIYIDDKGNLYKSIGDLKTELDTDFYTTKSGAAFTPEGKSKTTLPIENINESE